MAITNNMIIENARANLIAEGLLNPAHEIHTFQRWKALGYSVKKGEHAIAKFAIWKYGERKRKTEDGGEEVEIVGGGCFMKTSAFFSTAQVEPLKA